MTPLRANVWHQGWRNGEEPAYTAEEYRASHQLMALVRDLRSASDLERRESREATEEAESISQSSEVERVGEHKSEWETEESFKSETIGGDEILPEGEKSPERSKIKKKSQGFEDYGKRSSLLPPSRIWPEAYRDELGAIATGEDNKRVDEWTGLHRRIQILRNNCWSNEEIMSAIANRQWPSFTEEDKAAAILMDMRHDRGVWHSATQRDLAGCVNAAGGSG